MRSPAGEAGASSVEYGLVLTAIAAAILVVVLALGQVVHSFFGQSCTRIGSGSGAGTVNCDK